MRVIFAGTPEVATLALDALLASEHDVVAVVTRPDAPAGRGRRAVPSAVRRSAEALGVQVLTPDHPSDPAFAEQLRALAPDVAPVVAYGGLIPPSLLDLPRYGWINLHFSLLPAWRGAAPVQHALMAGDEITGATVFAIERGLDTGPVLGSMTERIRPDDTSGALLDRLARMSAPLLLSTLDALEAGTAAPLPQPSDGVSLAPRITVDDARVRWDHPAQAVDRLVRACTPAPGAWTTFRDERIKLGPVTPVAELPVGSVAPGAVKVGKNEVLVGTATVPVRLSQVRPAGRRSMPAPDWARGARASEETMS